MPVLCRVTGLLLVNECLFCTGWLVRELSVWPSPPRRRGESAGTALHLWVPEHRAHTRPEKWVSQHGAWIKIWCLMTWNMGVGESIYSMPDSWNNNPEYKTTTDILFLYFVVQHVHKNKFLQFLTYLCLFLEKWTLHFKSLPE